jgi:hypothetical protein
MKDSYLKLKVIRLLVLTAALMLLVGCGGMSESDIEATVEAKLAEKMVIEATIEARVEERLAAMPTPTARAPE